MFDADLLDFLKNGMTDCAIAGKDTQLAFSLVPVDPMLPELTCVAVSTSRAQDPVQDRGCYEGWTVVRRSNKKLSARSFEFAS